MSLSADDLIAAFTELAQADPELRIDRTKVGDVDEIRLVGWRDVQTKHKFEALSSDAVKLFAPAGDDDEVTRWLWIVRHQAPELVEPDQKCLGYAIVEGKRVEMVVETIPHAASASSLVVRRLRDVKRRQGQLTPPPTNPVDPSVVAAAQEACPTLESALIYLARRPEGEPFSSAFTWVHSRCRWPSRRNGAELGDYIGQLSRGEIVDAGVREAVVDALRELDTPEHRKAFWLELLRRFPDLAKSLVAETKPGKEPTPERFVPTRADLNILEVLAAASTTLAQVDIQQRSGEAIRTVKERLPKLEEARLINRPHGKRKGYAITDAGRLVLSQSGAR